MIFLVKLISITDNEITDKSLAFPFKLDIIFSETGKKVAEIQELPDQTTLSPSTLSASLLPLKTMLMSSHALSYVNTSQTLSIHQMILGYRESAAFLYRSAEELEKLLVAYS